MPRQHADRFGPQAVFACALLVFLLLLHEALMVNEHHAVVGLHDAVATAGHQRAAVGAVTRADLGVSAAHGAPAVPHDGPGVPRGVLGGCPVAQAVLPLLLLLLLLSVALAGRGPERHTRTPTHGAAGSLLPTPAPPLPPGRRRALLQVFLN
jgi:hypothetical protein